MEITRIGKYQITRTLGEGPFGFVHQALDTETGQPVALKIIRYDYGQEYVRQLTSFFKDLDRTCIKHTNLVPVYTYGETEGRFYYGMEYLEGGNLEDKLQGQIRPVEKPQIPAILTIAIQIADALGYLHSKNILHRNLKPTNILFTGEGQVKLSGFGEVYLTERPGETHTAFNSWNHAYMSPEQKNFLPELTPASDIYSFGLILYELFTGAAYQANTTHPPDLPRTLPDFPAELTSLLADMLSEDPAQRPQSGYEVKSRLSEIILSETDDTPSIVFVDMRLQSGTNTYHILNMLGHGGTGFVYKARSLNGVVKDCVLKIIRADIPAMDRHFCFEISLLQRLNHPGLPRVLDEFYFTDKNQVQYHCMVMDFIGTINLDKHCQETLRQGRLLPISAVLRWADQLCDILTYLHTQNPPVIHRDIKPSNIIRASRQDQVVLIDFGISKESRDGQTTTIAAKGMITNGFSPPEQYDTEKKTTTRSDIYALGATLYNLLTGERPPVSISILRKQSAGEKDTQPQVCKQRTEVPTHISEAIYTAMQVDEQARFANVEQFRAALKNKAYRAPRPRKPTNSSLNVMVGLILVALLLAVTYLLTRPVPPSDQVDPTLIAWASELEATSQALEKTLGASGNSATAKVINLTETVVYQQKTAAAQSIENAMRQTETARTAQAALTNATVPAQTITVPPETKTAVNTKLPGVVNASPTTRPTSTRIFTPVPTYTSVPAATYAPTKTNPPPVLPDLTVSGVSVQYAWPYPCVRTGDSPTLQSSVTIQNIGTGISGLTNVNFNGSVLRTGGNLLPGQSTTLSGFSNAGFNADVTVDSSNEVAESNENNNHTSRSISIPTSPPACPTPTPIPPIPSNMLNNPGFESGFSGWSWNPNNGACSSAIYTNAWEPAHGGVKLLATGKSKDYPNCNSVYQDITTSGNAGQKYTLSAWLRSPWGAQGPLDMVLWNLTAGGGNKGFVTVTGMDKTVWKCYQAVLTLTSSTNRLRAEIYLPNLNMDVQVDDVIVVPGEYQLCP